MPFSSPPPSRTPSLNKVSTTNFLFASFPFHTLLPLHYSLLFFFFFFSPFFSSTSIRPTIYSLYLLIRCFTFLDGGRNLVPEH